MAIDVGNAAGWLNGYASPSTPVTDLSPHVDGGSTHSNVNANVNNPSSALRIGAAYVIGALILLWFMGVIVVKSANF